MIRHVLRAVALLAVVSAGGAVWLLVRDETRPEPGLQRPGAVRRLTVVSALVVLVTVAFLRPWYWDLAIARRRRRRLLAWSTSCWRRSQHRTSPASGGAIAVAMGRWSSASGLVTLGGTAAVIDGAALVGGKPVPVPHDGQVLGHPVLYQVFWGPAWDRQRRHPGAGAGRRVPARRCPLAVGVGWSTPGSGCGSFSSGGCWIDPDTPRRGPGCQHLVGPVPRRAPPGLRPAAPRSGRARASPPLRSRGPCRRCGGGAVARSRRGVRAGRGVGPQRGAVAGPARRAGRGRLDGRFAPGVDLVRLRMPRAVRFPAVSPRPTRCHTSSSRRPPIPSGTAGTRTFPCAWAARYFLSHGPTSLLGTAPAFQGEVADLCEPGQPDAAGAAADAHRGRLTCRWPASTGPGTAASLTCSPDGGLVRPDAATVECRTCRASTGVIAHARPHRSWSSGARW